MTSTITIRSKILIFMVLLLDTPAHKFAIKRNHGHFYESLNLDAVTSNMIHLPLILRRLTVYYYWTE